MSEKKTYTYDDFHIARKFGIVPLNLSLIIKRLNIYQFADMFDRLNFVYSPQSRKN